MDNIHYINEDDPKQLFDGIAMIEDGYDPCGMDDSPLLDLDDSDGKKRIEYRHHKRFQLNKDAFALIRSILRRAPENSRQKHGLHRSSRVQCQAGQAW